MDFIRRIFINLVLGVVVCGCAASRPPIPPGTIPEARDSSAEDEAYGQEVLRAMMQQYRLSRDDREIARIRDIVDRLSHAARGPLVTWHVYLFDDASFKNAAATRGNHIFVWTGILSEVASDEQLAAILAHEMAHVLAQHTAPDPTEEAARILSGVVGQASGIIAVQNGAIGIVGDLTRILVQQTIEAIALNPGLQQKELEADSVGLFLMADAGINPRAAIEFWENAQFSSGVSAGPSVFSSHPSSVERRDALRALLPEAMQRYSSGGLPAPRQNFRSEPSDNSALSPPTYDPARRIQLVPRRAPLLVHAEPDAKSAVLHELPLSATVEMASQRDGWMEITAPVRGWIRGRDVRPWSLAPSSPNSSGN